MLHPSYAEIFSVQSLELKPRFRSVAAGESVESELPEALVADIKLCFVQPAPMHVVCIAGQGPVIDGEKLILPQASLDTRQKKALWSWCCEQFDGN